MTCKINIWLQMLQRVFFCSTPNTCFYHHMTTAKHESFVVRMGKDVPNLFNASMLRLSNLRSCFQCYGCLRCLGGNRTNESSLAIH